MKPVLALLMILSLAAPASAEILTGKEARKLLFAPGKMVAQMEAGAGLAENEVAVLKQIAESQPYYGAIAVSPDDGMMHEATVAAVNYHDTTSAEVAALIECNSKKAGKSDCVIAARILPKGWKEPGFGLSSDATAAFKGYDKKTGAFAVSPSTGAFGMGAGEGAADAALAQCAAMNAAAKDCAVVIAN